MTVSGMSVGQSYTIGLYDGSLGSIVDLGSVQSFKSTMQKHNIKNMPYNAPPIYGYIPDGASGHFSLIRTNPDLENLFLQLVALFNNGGDLIPGYINETIRETGGGLSRYQYTQSVFFLTESADVSRDKNVPMSVEWMASEKINLLA